MNNETVTTHNAACQVASITDARGFTTQYTYDARGQVTSVIEDNTATTTYRYDEMGRLVETVDALGRQSITEYDDLGRAVKQSVTSPDGAGAGLIVVSETIYDDAGQVEATKDALGRTTTYVYDSFGRLSTIVGPQGTTVQHYDNLNRVVQVDITLPDSQTRTIEQKYNNAGQLVEVIDGPNSVAYQYDDNGRVIQTSDVRGGVGTVAYAFANEVRETVDPLGLKTVYRYDDSGLKTHEILVVGTIDPDPNDPIDDLVTRYVYNANGWLTQQIDPLGQTTTYVYNAMGQVIQSIDALNGTTAFTYDEAGNRLSLTDPVGNTTTWTYDHAGRMLTDTNELAATRTYTYDLVGNLVTYVDRNGREIEYRYDSWNRRTDESWLDDTSTVGHLTWSYDLLNRLTEASDVGNSVYTYGYNTLNQLISVDNNGTAHTPRVQLAYNYDAYGRRTQLSATVGGVADLVNTYSYNNSSGTLILSQGGNNVSEKLVEIETNLLGQLSSVTRYAGTSANLVGATNYAYDALNRLQALTHLGSSSEPPTIDSLAYGYDAASRITSITSAVDGTTEYSYDATNQLLSATNATMAWNYQYDANGNRISTATGPVIGPPVIATYVTGADNQTLSDGTFTYAYDDEGNRISKTRISDDPADDYKAVYVWDYRNRMVAVVNYDNEDEITGVQQIAYDINNHRISMTTNEAIESYVFDGDNVLFDFIAEGTAAPTLARRYLTSTAIVQIFAQEDIGETTTETKWLYTDHQQTVRYAADSVGTVIVHFTYDPYGKILSGDENIVTRHFTGKQWNAFSQLQENWNCWYDPILGKWASIDSIGFAAKDMNLMRFIQNITVSHRDATGLDIFVELFGQAIRDSLVQKILMRWQQTH